MNYLLPLTLIVFINSLGLNAQECTPVPLSMEVQVSSSNDDAEESQSGSMYRNSSDLEMTTDSKEQTVGIRFQNLFIPSDATISKAYIQFSVDETSSYSTRLSIHGEDVDHANEFSSSKYNISRRVKTTASATWSPLAWNTKHEQGVKQQTSDLTSIVQEVIDREGWQSGNAMSFIISGTGKRVAESYDGESDEAPILHIEYNACPNSNTNTTAMCYALTDNSSKLYKVSMSPDGSTLPTPITMNISKTFNGEGSAYRATNNQLYAFKASGDDRGPSDLYAIDIESGTISTVKSSIISGAVDGAEFYYDPSLDKEILYILSGESRSKLYAFYADTWEPLNSYPKDLNGDTKGLSSLAIDPITGAMYGVDDYNYDNKNPKIYKINLQTAETTFIVQTKSRVDAEGLAYASDGNLYLEDERYLNGRKIYKVDLATGNLTPAANLGGSGDVEGISCNGTQIAIENPSIEIDNNQTLEGDLGNKTLTFSVTLSKPAPRDVSFSYTLNDKTATNGVDYQEDTPAVGEVITIPKDANSTTISVKILGDTIVENNETFEIQLTDIENAIYQPESIVAVGTVIDDDTKPLTLVAEYRFDDCEWNSSTGEVKDHSGVYGDGTAHSVDIIKDGVVGRSSHFDSRGEHIEIPHNPNIALNDNLSISLWIKPETFTKTFQSLLSKKATKELDLQIKKGYLYFRHQGKKFGHQTAQLTQTNQWYHIAVIRDMDTQLVKYYINANKVFEESFKSKTIKSSTNSITIGKSNGNAHPFTGAIDELKIFTTVISESDIQKIYTNELSGLNWDGSLRGEITCAETPPNLRIDNVSKKEGNDGETTEFTFTVSLDKPASTLSYLVQAGFYFTLNDGTAQWSDADYGKNVKVDGAVIQENGFILVKPTTKEIKITVEVLGDNKVEPNENFYLELYAPKFIGIEKNIGIGTIINDDAPNFNVERTNSFKDKTQAEKELFYTQISGRDFDYAVVSYDESTTNPKEQALENSTLKIELIDNNSTLPSEVLYSHYIYIKDLQSRFDVISTDDLKIGRATRNAIFRVSYLVDENGSMVKGQYNDEVNYNATKALNSEISLNAKDNFAIRPASFRMEIRDNNVSYIDNSSKAKEPIDLAAEYEYELTAKATSAGTEQSVQNYTVKDSKELNAQLIFTQKKNKNCSSIDDAQLSERFNYSFENGIMKNGKVAHNNVGTYNLTISDEQWTSQDQNLNDNLAGCIKNSGAISSNANEKSGCNIVSNTDTTHHDIEIDFQAYEFNLDNSSIDNRPSNGQNFVYMSDLDISQDIGMIIKSDIIAQGKEHTPLTNFTKGCFAKDVTLFLDYNITTPEYNQTLTYDELNTTKGTPVGFKRVVTYNDEEFNAKDVTSTHLDNRIPLTSDMFLDANEGKSKVAVLYNINKNLSETTNPIRVGFKALDINSTDAISKVMNQDRVAIKTENTGQVNDTRTFYFSQVASDYENYPD
ncbi:MAG: hypothetical protein K0U38_11150, partial [Epsilonproteobacteria bacterium]|nr:hypothetical protein [Campylobacterota bacterium]